LTENGTELQTAHEVRIPGWTERRFFAEAPEQGLFEFKDGELVMHSPVGIAHQRIVGFFTTLLRNYVNLKQSGEVFAGPAVLRLREELDREPDIFFVSRKRAPQVKSQYVETPVDFVAEVTSAGSEARDFDEKRVEYESSGIPEYWIVDPKKRSVSVHLLREGAYRVKTSSKGRLESSQISGFYLQVDWLWAAPPPPEVRCLQEILGEA
jgi:Uma2 family endonuclease